MEEIMEPGICQPPASGVNPSLADVAPAVLRKYFDANPTTFLTQHHMQSYEAFVFRELPEIVLSENPITILKEPLGDGKYKYKTEIFVGGADVSTAEELAIDVGAPILTLDNGKTVRRMFPNDARIRNLTYAATFQADIVIRMTFTMESDVITRTLEVKKFPLFHIPILIGSKLCTTHGATRDLLFEMGECRNDQGGYFIIDGSEKLLITRQEQAFNSVFVSLKPPVTMKSSSYTSVVCQNPVTKQTNRVALYRLLNNNAIRVSIPFVRGTIPLFCLFRALGVESDEEIVRMILPDVNSPQTTLMESALLASIEDARPIYTTAHAIEFIRTLTKGFIVSSVLNILHENVFAHVLNKPLARAQYLAELVRKILRVEMGLELPTNRDDIRNQRLLPTGSLLRGLFSECWKAWKKSVRYAVDIQYNYNRSLYQNENFLNIFSPGNISKVLNAKELNDSLMRGFRGRWGLTEFTLKTGVIQPVARISYLDAMSHTRRVVSDFDTGLLITGPRHLHPSQVGYFCTSETPTGKHIGATKNLSILTAISVSSPFDKFTDWLFQKAGVIAVAAANRAIAANATSVQINGGTVGFTTMPMQLTRVLKLMKWTACLPPTTGIAFNTPDNILRVYMDDGRPLRPLWHNEAGGKWPAIMYEVQKGNKELPTWRDLVCGTLPATAERTIFASDFVDPLAEGGTFEEYETLLTPHVGAIEYIDPYEGNEAYISWWGNVADLSPEHTHTEIHPSTLLGLLTSMIPFANHNQSPRNQLSCSQSKQGIGYYATNYENRFDTYGSMLCYGEGALCRTIVHDAVAGGAMPYGANIIFCLNSFNGYNQDDGILFNRSSIERGLFRSLAFRSYETAEETDEVSKAIYRVGNPRNVLSWYDIKPGYDYSQLDEYGVIKEGTVITDKMVLVGRYLTNPETGKIKDASLVPTVFTKGRVDKVAVLHQANGMRLVRIRILEERVPELGDKFSTRHGQKGTMGMLLDAVDMPRTADGMVPDVIVNPHCIPSRMTIAQMLEQVFGKFGAVVGAKMNATTFMNDDQSFTAIANALQDLGLQREGEEILYSGITGKMYTSSVFMGPMYFMRLKHLTQDKLNSRSTGRKEIRTHQPTGGRGNEGGMRIGNMERDSLIAHGVADFLNESMMKRADATTFYICNGCGTIPIYNEGQDLFFCTLCDGPVTYQGETADTIGIVLPVRKSRTTFSRVEMPYALKLLDQEIGSCANIGLRFMTEKHGRAFREPTQIGLEEMLEIQEKEEVKAMNPELAINAAAAAAPMAAMPIPDGPGEDAPADLEDEGQPAKNDNPTNAVLPAGVPVIDFHQKVTKFKQFTNYFPVRLNLNGKVWPSAEHYFQAMKFPDNPVYQETIRTAKTPAQAKALGTNESIPIRPDWTTYRDKVMLMTIREKFSDRHPELKEMLLSTGSAVLRDASPMDNYWGIGKKKLGQNKLGKILMQVRDELRAPVPAPVPVPAPSAVAAGEAPSMMNDLMMTIEAVLPPPAPEPEPAPEAKVDVPAPSAEAQVDVPAPEPPTVDQPPMLEISEVDATQIPDMMNIPVPEIPAPAPPADPDVKVVTVTNTHPPKKS